MKAGTERSNATRDDRLVVDVSLLAVLVMDMGFGAVTATPTTIANAPCLRGRTNLLFGDRHGFPFLEILRRRSSVWNGSHAVLQRKSQALSL